MKKRLPRRNIVFLTVLSLMLVTHVYAQKESKWNFSAEKKVIVSNKADGEWSANLYTEDVIVKALLKQKIMPTRESIKLIEELNPRLQEKWVREEDKIKLLLLNFPATGARREAELQAAYDKEIQPDSTGTARFIEKNRQFAKLFQPSLARIKDSLLLKDLYSLYMLLQKAASNPNIPYKKHEADLLNSELDDFYDYYLELSNKDSVQEIDREYITEFTKKVFQILKPYFIKEAKPTRPDSHGPSHLFSGEMVNFFFADNYFADPDPLVQLFFYVYTPNLETPRNSFLIYTLNERQYKRIKAKEITFNDLSEKPAANCPTPASVTAKYLDMSFKWYIVAVRRNEPEVIAAFSVIDATSLLAKPNRWPEMAERYAIPLFTEN